MLRLRRVRLGMVHRSPSYRGGVSMAPVAALGKKTEALRNYSPGDAHARAHPALCGSSRIRIWVNFALFRSARSRPLRRCPWPAGKRQQWGESSIRKTQRREPCCGGATPGARSPPCCGARLAWLHPPKPPETGSAAGGRKMKPGRVFFQTMHRATLQKSCGGSSETKRHPCQPLPK